jgi:DNA-binding NarL/FixJ family response regulator
VNVMIVDDSRIVRDQLRQLLSDCSNVRVVADTDDIAEALRSAESADIDFYIIDIAMPKGSGFTLVERIKSNHLGGKVIMLTNYPDMYFRDRARALQVEYFFDKSTEFENVLDVLAAA